MEINHLRKGLLLDRALLTDYIIYIRSGQETNSTLLLTNAAKYYKQLLYEPINISAYENFIYSVEYLRDKLVPVSKDVELDKDEPRLLEQTISTAVKRISVAQAIHQYERGRQGSARPHEETLGYVIRLLLLARQHDVDIAPWSIRANLILSLFEESGIRYSKMKISTELSIIKTDFCRFPYLGQMNTTTKNNYFGLLLLEGSLDENPSQSVKNVLFLTADPSNASRLRLGEEAREIQEKLQLAKLRTQFQLHQRTSVRPQDLSQAILDTNPDIVHFSGHGTADGALCFENQVGQVHPISPDALSSLFENFSNHVKCVVLNACYSEVQAHAIAKHIDYVIGMKEPIGDKAAIAFTIGFYQALGAGRSFDDAYKLGCTQISLHNIPEEFTPILVKKLPSKAFSETVT